VLILRQVTVVDTRDGSLSAGQDVRVEGTTITGIGAAGPDDAGATVIDAPGRFVVPGYNDMHAHPLTPGTDPAGPLALMLAHGITGFRQMGGTAQLLGERRAGTLRLPERGPALLATPGDLLTPLNAGSPEAAAATVREQHAQGADFIKVGLTRPDAFFAAQAEAARLGMPIVGHLPGGIDVRAASRGGMKSIEHLGPGTGILAACSPAEDAIRRESAGPQIRLPPFPVPFLDRILAAVLRGIVVNPMARARTGDVAALTHAGDTFDEDRARELAKVFAADGTWQCPTLIRVRTQQRADAPEYTSDPNLRYLSAHTVEQWRRSNRTFARQPAAARETFRRNYAIQLRLLRIFEAEGVRILAGTDACGAAWVVPGASLHQEFAELAAAGLSALRVLQAATADAAEFLGTTATMGAVAPGRAADLVLLSANPLEHHRNLGAIDGVVRAGRHYPAAALQSIKDEIAAARSGG
jgi:imidazolonepropionase-like amidohydrolase